MQNIEFDEIDLSGNSAVISEEIKRQVDADREQARILAARREADRQIVQAASRKPVPVEVGKEYEVTVTEVSQRGDGVAKIDNFVIFVPGTEPGWTGKVTVTYVGRSNANANGPRPQVDEEFDITVDKLSLKGDAGLARVNGWTVFVEGVQVGWAGKIRITGVSKNGNQFFARDAAAPEAPKRSGKRSFSFHMEEDFGPRKRDTGRKENWKSKTKSRAPRGRKVNQAPAPDNQKCAVCSAPTVETRDAEGKLVTTVEELAAATQLGPVTRVKIPHEGAHSARLATTEQPKQQTPAAFMAPFMEPVSWRPRRFVPAWKVSKIGRETSLTDDEVRAYMTSPLPANTILDSAIFKSTKTGNRVMDEREKARSLIEYGVLPFSDYYAPLLKCPQCDTDARGPQSRTTCPLHPGEKMVDTNATIELQPVLAADNSPLEIDGQLLYHAGGGLVGRYGQGETLHFHGRLVLTPEGELPMVDKAFVEGALQIQCVNCGEYFPALQSGCPKCGNPNDKSGNKKHLGAYMQTIVPVQPGSYIIYADGKIVGNKPSIDMHTFVVSDKVTTDNKIVATRASVDPAEVLKALKSMPKARVKNPDGSRTESKLSRPLYGLMTSWSPAKGYYFVNVAQERPANMTVQEETQMTVVGSQRASPGYTGRN